MTQCQRASDADLTVQQQYVKAHSTEITADLMARGEKLQALSFTIFRIKEEISKWLMIRLQAVTRIQQLIKACRRSHSFDGNCGSLTLSFFLCLSLVRLSCSLVFYFSLLVFSPIFCISSPLSAHHSRHNPGIAFPLPLSPSLSFLVSPFLFCRKPFWVDDGLLANFPFDR